MHFHRTLVERIPKQPNWTPLIFVKNMVSVFMLSCMIFKKYLDFGDRAGCKKTFTCEYSDHFSTMFTSSAQQQTICRSEGCIQLK